jgi:aminopeptidase YwaD
MNDLRATFQHIWQACSGEAAWQTVADLSRLHRIQASPGYRRAAGLVYERLLHEGLQADMLTYPADEATCFWAWPSFQEWECHAAKLELIGPGAGRPCLASGGLESPGAEASVLADFRACPLAVIQRSAPFVGEAELVLLEDGRQAADYEGLDVAGKVVLTSGDLRPVWQMAVQERGAVGILFDGMRSVAPVRPEGDLADERQYTSFWWQPGDVRCFGFVLTPRQGHTLRCLLKEASEPVRVRAAVDSRLYDGAIEVVSGLIPGTEAQEVVVVAHLCHPLPSANDNASGAAAALEAARALQTLVTRGQLPPPRRSLRFLWLPEMTGSVAYLSQREADLGRMVAGLNLDMVGEDQRQTGSSWLIERPPDAAASFAPELLALLRDEIPALKGMFDVSASHTGLGAYPLYRQAEVPFSGGSDHYVFSDPTVGVPMPMLIQWPDRFYHTSADTPERTDPHSLARAGALAAMYAYWLGTAGVEEATWLGYQMAARFQVALVEASRAGVTAILSQDDGVGLAEALAGLDRRVAYLLDRQKAALRSLERLGPIQCLLVDLAEQVAATARDQIAWLRGVADLRAASLGLADRPVLVTPERSPEEEEAACLVPVRQARGPLPLEQLWRNLPEDDVQAWRRLQEARGERSAWTLAPLALYWADGQRSILDIAGLVELETGSRDLELLLLLFRLLEKLSLVTL